MGIKSDLTNYKTQVQTETQQIYDRLNILTSDTHSIKSDLANFKSQVNNETININNQLNLKSNTSNPIFTGTLTADSLVVNNTGLIVLKSGNVSIGDNLPSAKLVIKGSGSDSSTAVLTIKNASNANLFYIDNSGNVGIGTTTPSVKLEIIGAVKSLNTGNRIYAVYAE